MITKGQKISDRYEIIKSIGEGGMANVYLAHDTILNRDVAVKVLRGDLSNDEKFVRRFQREALSASSLSHPNIVEMYDVGEDNGMYFIVMEFVNGKTLKQLIKKRGALTLSETIDIMLQLTDGISQAHESYIIHRDIKPQNIMIQENGEIKITDFGIAIALNNTQLTQTNSVMGSVHYLPPEQASGKRATVKSDIYSMGIMFYELLTGNLPFKGETAFEIAYKHIKDDIPSVRAFNKQIPQSVENIILKATAKNPKNRYNSSKEMHDDLLECLKEEHLNDPRIVFKYPEHDTQVKKEDMIIDEATGEVKIIKDSLIEEEDADRKTNIVLWILSGLFLIIILAIAGFLIYISKGTTVENVTIPDVSKMTVIEAENVLQKQGFEVATEVQQIGDEEIEKGLIVKTSPAIGRTVKKGTTITLYESLGKIKYTVENYVGKNYIEVKTILENNYGLNVVVTKISPEDDGKEHPSEIILSQEPEEGTQVSKGTNITLYIPDDTPTYPDFTDGTWTEKTIQEYCNKYSATCTFAYQETPGYKDGEIISQSRLAGTEIIKGYEQKITVAKVYETETETETEENN